MAVFICTDIAISSDNFRQTVWNTLPTHLAISNSLLEKTLPAHLTISDSYKDKGKVFHDQEPARGEYTTTECGVNYQLLAIITEVTQWGTPSCSRPQPAANNGVRDGRSN